MKKLIIFSLMIIINLLAPSNMFSRNCIYQCNNGEVQGGTMGPEDCNQLSNCVHHCEKKGMICLADSANAGSITPKSPSLPF